MTKDCWNLIGVWGDRTCLELQTHTHCRNCPVYATSGRNLLQREAPIDYITEWTKLLATEKSGLTDLSGQNLTTISVVIFRLGLEWLALSANLFKEVTQLSKIHTLPHRSNSILLGLVNIRGEIQMCISLGALLGIDPGAKNEQASNHVIYQRLVVVEKESNRWVFPVDEIYGVQRCQLDTLRSVPASIAKSSQTYTKSMIDWQNKNVGYLDDELVFYTLNKRVL